MTDEEPLPAGAPILVVLLDLVSLLILFYKTWKHNGTGFRYGTHHLQATPGGLATLRSFCCLLLLRGLKIAQVVGSLAQCADVWCLSGLTRRKLHRIIDAYCDIKVVIHHPLSGKRGRVAICVDSK